MNFFMYLAYVSLYVGAMWGLYCIVWRGRAFHRGSRTWLLCSLTLPIFLPFIRLSVPADSPVAAYQIQLPDVVVSAGSISRPALLPSWPAMTLWVYAGVAMLIALLYVVAYLRVLRQLHSGTKSRHYGYIIIANAGIGPGTLGRRIFFPQKAVDDAILRHELAHIRAGHRYDLALIQLLRIVFWASPAHWLVGRELKLVHEFEADRLATSPTDITAYGELLLSQSFGLRHSIIGHSFFHHPLKRRINMLQLSQHPHRRLRVYALAGFLMVAFSAIVVLAQARKSGAAGKSRSAEETSGATTVFRPEWLTNSKILPDGRVVFTRVDRMPELAPNLGTWLGSHLHYPDSARARGEEGRAVVQFVVDETGRPGAPTLTRSSGHPLLDEEALRVVREMPQWSAGKQGSQAVPVLLTLPVMFKLDENGKQVYTDGC